MSEYISQLSHDKRNENDCTQNDDYEGPETLQCEIKSVMNEMKRRKAAGQNDITVELLSMMQELNI